MKEILNYLKECVITTIFITVISILLFIIIYGINRLMYHKYDVNQDGKVNAQDYVEIKNYIMEK